MDLNRLPKNVISRWSEEDCEHKYENPDTREPIELTEEQAEMYVWGRSEDGPRGAQQRGKLPRGLFNGLEAAQ